MATKLRTERMHEYVRVHKKRISRDVTGAVHMKVRLRKKVKRNQT